MPRLSLLPGPAYRWNFVVLGVDISLFTLAVTFASNYGVLPLFVHHLSNSNVILGLIPAVSAFGSLLPPILVASLLQRRSRRKPFILGWTVVERLLYLFLAVLTLMLAPAHPTLLLWSFFALFGLSTIAGGASVAAWLDFVALTIPDDWRGRFFGLWTALGALLGLAGGALSAQLLREHSWTSGFALCFGCAFACTVVSFVFLAIAREGPPATPGPFLPRHRWGDYAALLRRDRNFVVYLVSSGFVTLAGLSVAFYTVDAKRALGLTDSGAGLYTVVLLGGTFIGNLFWGYVGDHAGHKRLLECGALCTALACGAALASDSIGGSKGGLILYGISFALIGLGASAVLLVGNTLVLDFGSAKDRPAYIGIASLALLPFACGGPILGGVLADHLGYGAVFLLCLLLGLAGAWVTIHYLRDPRRMAPVMDVNP